MYANSTRESMSKGNVFNIQRYTVHDGPGIRTEIFLKGCPLACRWCSNPEGLKARREPGVYPSRCIGRSVCGLCEKADSGAQISFDAGDKIESIHTDGTDRWICAADACPSDAIRIWGDLMSVRELMDIIKKDRTYYEQSGGGVTVSGGEPLLQAAFTAELLQACHEEGIHTCVESALHVDEAAVDLVLPHTDLFISDLKIMDPQKHQKYIGVSNEKILFNTRKLAEAGKDMILRIPVIPGINDDEENIRKTADFITGDLRNSVQELQLLNYMRLGEEKYRSLGRPYPMAGMELDQESANARLKEITAYFRNRGICCVTGKGK